MSKIVKNPGILDQEEDNIDEQGPQKENADGLKLQLQKLKHGMEQLIDSLAEGVIERDQFTARMDRTKIRIAEIEAKLGAQETGEERRAHVQALMSRLGSCQITSSRSRAIRIGRRGVRSSAPLYNALR